MIDDRRDQLSTLVDEAYSVVSHYAALAANKTLTEAEAKKRALAVVRAMRFGTVGYL